MNDPTNVEFRQPRVFTEKFLSRMRKLRRLNRDCAGHQTNARLAEVICSVTAQATITYIHPEEGEKTVRQCTPHRKEIVKAGYEITKVEELGPLPRKPPTRH